LPSPGRIEVPLAHGVITLFAIPARVSARTNMKFF